MPIVRQMGAGEPPSTIVSGAQALLALLREDRKLTLRETDALMELARTLNSVLRTREQDASAEFASWSFST